MPDSAGERKPLTSAELAGMRQEDLDRRAANKLHQKGPLPIHGHVSLEDSMRQERAQARNRAQAMGNDPSKMPDVGDLHGRRPQRPDRSIK